jgi:predicted transcriptional regulator
MSTRNPENLPRKQIPIRIDNQLHEKFTRISNRTCIPKSQLARFALATFLNDIETRGVSAVLEGCAV